MLAIAKFKIITAAVAAVLVVGGMSSVMISAVLHSDTAQADTALAANQLTLKTIIATMEKQREQVESLTIETKGYNARLVASKVLSSLQRFRGMDFSNEQKQVQEHVFSYKGGKRYLRIFNTVKKKSDDGKTTDTRRVTYNSERASDGVRV